MKKTIPVVIITFFLLSSAWAAFENNITVLKKAEIHQLTDDQLVDAYQDVLVELEAIRTFHATSGFTVTQYDEYRSFLKYRLGLLMEIHSRNLEIPAQMER